MKTSQHRLCGKAAISGSRYRRSKQLTMAAALLAAGKLAQSAETGVYQVYHVPMPESTVTEFNDSVNSAGNEVRTVLSIAVVLDGTLIWFDHSEDGMESFLTTPTQPTTALWGDGDPSNGFPPGFPGDTFEAGDVIVLDESYDITVVDDADCIGASGGPGSGCRLNGGDRFGSNKALAVTRAAWNDSPGSVLAGAVELEPESYWDSQYVLPIGEDTAGMFQTVWAVVGASESGTEVQLNGGGAVTLQAGESRVFENILEGDTIDASAPVQVTLLTGTGANYESRWFRVSSSEQWVGEYYSPVGTTVGDDPVTYYLFNSGDTAITVNVEDESASISSVAVAAGQTEVFTSTVSSGLHFQSTGGEPFYVMGAVDDAAVHDWGFSLVPAVGLTGQTVLGWAPGNEDLSEDNDSPVWVTAVDDTTLCVDYDRDGNIDLSQAITRLQMARLTDISDNDMTGALIYSINDINGDNTPNACYANGGDDTQTDLAVVWGQDPSRATSGFPSLDLGTTVLAVPKYAVSKRAELSNDADGSGNVTPGDSVTFIIEVDNYGALPLNNAELTDNMPQGLVFEADASDPGWDCGAYPTCTLGTFSVAPFSSVTYPLVGTIQSSGGTAALIANRVSLNPGTGDEITSGSAEVPVAYADVTTLLDFPATAQPSALVSGFVSFGNIGTLTAENTSYQVQLPAGLTDVSCSGATCNYNGHTGVVSVTGLPTSLSPGQWTGMVALGFTAPGSAGDIDVRSVVSTSSLQPSPHAPDTADAVIPLTATPGDAEADVISRVNPPATAAPGSTVTVPVTYSNLGPASATGISYDLNLPAGLSGVSCSGATCIYNAVTGEVTVSGVSVSLASGESVKFNLLYTAPASGSVVVSSDIDTGDEPAGNIGNNPDSRPTIISNSASADVSTTVSPPSSSNVGEAVTVPVTYSNVGANDATGVTYALKLTETPENVSVSYQGSNCDYDHSSGAVSSCGLPDTLVPGQTLELTLGYTAPTGSPVRVTSVINTGSAETSTLNNTAAAETVVTGSDMVVDISGLDTPQVGVPYSGTYTCTNQGDTDASAGTDCTISGLPDGLGRGSCDIEGVAWTAGDPVPVGATVRCEVTGTPTTAGEVTTTGDTDAGSDLDPSNNTMSRSLLVRAESTPGPATQPTAVPVFGAWGLMASIVMLLTAAWRKRQLMRA